MIVYASNISSGGGKVLLDELLMSEPFGKINVAFIDDRYIPPPGLSCQILIRVKPSLIHRWMAELELLRIDEKYSEDVLCFGNLPPFFNLRNKTILYLQNAFLLKKTPAPIGRIKPLMRYFYEKAIIYFFLKNVDVIWVQTDFMKKWVREDFGVACEKKLFFPNIEKTNTKKQYDYVLFTGLDEHKNFNLFYNSIKSIFLKKKIKFYIILAGINSKIKNKILELQNIRNLDITYSVNLSHDECIDVMRKSRDMIILSKLESLSLPVIEANQLGMKIVGLDLPYIREVALDKCIIEEPFEMNLKNFFNDI